MDSSHKVGDGSFFYICHFDDRKEEKSPCLLNTNGLNFLGSLTRGSGWQQNCFFILHTPVTNILISASNFMHYALNFICNFSITCLSWLPYFLKIYFINKTTSSINTFKCAYRDDPQDSCSLFFEENTCSFLLLLFPYHDGKWKFGLSWFFSLA